MIDIHCHMLPLVDDGAESLDEALEMARMAADSGVSAVIATPHCNLPFAQDQNYKTDEFSRRFTLFQRSLALSGIPLRVYPGAEILCTPEVPRLLREGKLLTLAGGPYVLVEFFFDESADYIDDMLAAIAEQGYIPVLAHPERYEAVQRNPAIAQRWFHTGYIIQLNKGSILGRLGRRAQRCAYWLLERGLAHVVASDAHSAQSRTPRMEELEQLLYELCGVNYAHILLRENPERILRGQRVVESE